MTEKSLGLNQSKLAFIPNDAANGEIIKNNISKKSINNNSE